MLVGEKEKFAVEYLVAQRNEDSSHAFIFDCRDQTFNNGDAAVLAYGSKSRRLDTFASNTIAECVTVEDISPVTDDISVRH